MGGRGASSGIKRGKASNAKYNGFSITDSKGNTSHYKVINGKVEPAVVEYGSQNMLKGIGSKDPIQAAYDRLGSVDKVIKQVNKIGKGKASTLSDKAVEKMNADYRKRYDEFEKSIPVRSSKKGVNRHRTFWSAM